MFARFYLAALVVAGLYLAHASPLVVRQDLVCARNYTVEPDDTCFTICMEQHVSSFQLAFDNPIVGAADCVNLFPGEILCLGFEGQDCTDIHVVALNETCDDITAGADITLATLLANNPNVDENCSNLQAGEVLCVADEVINYSE